MCTFREQKRVKISRLSWRFIFHICGLRKEFLKEFLRDLALLLTANPGIMQRRTALPTPEIGDTGCLQSDS